MLSKSARYGLIAALEMASQGPDRPVVAAQVAAECRIPAAVLAKIFQRLVRAGIAVGSRGAKGGYRLRRSATRITVLDVLSAFEPERRPRMGDPRLDLLFDEVEEVMRSTYASVSLETLAKPAAPPRRRPAPRR